NETSYPYAQDVKHSHRRGEQTYVQNVSGRGKYGRDDKDGQNRITNVAPHPARGDHSHQREEKHDNRKLEHRTQAENDRHEKIGVLAHRDHRLELLAVSDQEIERGWVDHL